MPYLTGLPYVQDGSRFENQYTIMPGRVLGKGASGVVHACMSLETGAQYACKVIPKIYPVEDPDAVKQWRRTEVAALHLLSRDANIVTMEAIFEDEETIRIVTELCDGGDIFSTHPPPLSEADAAQLLKRVVRCIQACHSHCLIHRDVKPENFMFLERARGARAAVKMIDFGLAAFHTPGQRHSQMVGTPSYAAPEILRGEYGPEVDVWAAGVILHCMLCGALPFSEEAFWRGDHQLFLDSEPWARVSHGAKLLVKAMLHPDPQQRPLPEEVLQDPWVTGNASCAVGSCFRSCLPCCFAPKRNVQASQVSRALSSTSFKS